MFVLSQTTSFHINFKQIIVSFLVIYNSMLIYVNKSIVRIWKQKLEREYKVV